MATTGYDLGADSGAGAGAGASAGADDDAGAVFFNLAISVRWKHRQTKSN